MRIFPRSQLSELKKSAEFILNAVNGAMKMYDSRLTVDSVSKYNDMLEYARQVPDDYFYFRVLDKSCRLVFIGSDNGKINNRHYAIECYRFIPHQLEQNDGKKYDSIFASSLARYGDFNNYDIAVKWFYRCCMDMIQSFNVQLTDIVKIQQQELFKEGLW